MLKTTITDEKREEIKESINVEMLKLKAINHAFDVIFGDAKKC
jgi:hypothetical protein